MTYIYAARNTSENTVVMTLLFRTRRVASEIRNPNSADIASENSGSVRLTSRNAVTPKGDTGYRTIHMNPAAPETIRLMKAFITKIMNSREIRISRGRMGMDSSRSLSLASYSCVLAVNTVPTNITAKSSRAQTAK